MLLSKNGGRLLVMLNFEYLKILRLPFFVFPIGSTHIPMIAKLKAVKIAMTN